MSDLIAENQSQRKTDRTRARLDGVVIGVLVGLNEQHQPLVAFPGNPRTDSAVAKSTIQFSAEDIGFEVALLFENGDPLLPMVIGRIQNPERAAEETAKASADVDGERLTLTADREIVLKCGKASITLTRSGKIILRGNYLLSRSSGVNRIKGGSVQIN
ncbi:MAG: hypothetical protein B6D72_00965 [gamma proteobacterium symbiont of Ctena orbiculata]|uniref:DUF6484 domain-containing protein n=1 Tax=Candidatus Thiodiazotropha taylori TaxID=2792791 RepID=A0A944MFZ0_9GAMM|nr:hypothetical protein [Candidatus Thiodiazotropha taylori]PUB77928.1 MAG: hypothetical protein DBP01_18465 [gamma proteobacterium symbiont of Ctena orbiculata]MBT2990717.1 hypothetical protein [Candidatus Thiodiazotropha taylori]MBT2996660.1 hypothetical protein [Candidatus Thiodiazotropha taylori]MBT3000700.1 hypothetical protein [Candidatus Thiodiazotropha taylori]